MNNSKDVNYDLFQATEKIFKANSFKNESDIFNMFDLERYNLPLTSYDNLYKYINTFDSENLETIQNIYRVNLKNTLNISGKILKVPRKAGYPQGAVH